MYHVGNKVQIAPGLWYQGRIGRVFDLIHTPDGILYEVQFDDGERVRCASEGLILVVEEPEETAEYEVGDIVQVQDPRGSAYLGTVAIDPECGAYTRTAQFNTVEIFVQGGPGGPGWIWDVTLLNLSR